MLLRRLRGGGVGATVVLGMLLALAVSCPAGIVVTFRESSLAASGRTSIDEFTLFDQSPDLGLYDQFRGDSIAGAGGGTTEASARQRSSVASAFDLDGFASGDASAHVSESDAIAAAASSFFSVSFEVTDSPHSLSIQGHVQSTFDAISLLTLRRSGQDVIFQQLVDEGSDERLDFDRALVLSPGTYSLVAEARVTGTPTPASSAFDVRFSVDDGATVIPLPPGVIGGAMMLIIAGAGWARSRIRHV